MGCWGALANYSFVSASVFPQLAEFYLIQTEIQSKRKLIWTISVDCKSEIVWNMFKKKKMTLYYFCAWTVVRTANQLLPGRGSSEPSINKKIRVILISTFAK